MKKKEFIKAIKDISNSNVYCNFESVENKLSNRPDLHALLLLDKIVPSEHYSDILSSAEHDIVYINIDIKKLIKNVTIEHIYDLCRCGITYDSEVDCLVFYV